MSRSKVQNGSRRPTQVASLYAERVKKEHYLAELRRVELEEKLGNLVSVDDFAKRWDQKFVKLKQIIKGSHLNEQEQFQVLTELEGVLKG